MDLRADKLNPSCIFYNSSTPFRSLVSPEARSLNPASTSSCASAVFVEAFSKQGPHNWLHSFPGSKGFRQGNSSNNIRDGRIGREDDFKPSTLFSSGGSFAAQASLLWPRSFGKKNRVSSAEKALAESKRKKIMVLMSDTGGGHRASAEALKAGFDILYGDKYKVDYVDVWSNWTPYPFNELPKTYSFMVKNPSIWRMGYYVQQPRMVHYPTSAITSLFVSNKISMAFDLYQPDLVVSVHPLMQHVPLRVLRQRIKKGLQKPVEFATVVTDLTTCHNTWFHPDVDRCFVPTEFARSRALKMGLTPTQVTMHGLPIRPTFSAPQQPKNALRRKLGMEKSAPAVLLVGGGEGMGAIEKTVEAIVEKVGTACQLVVICGRNKKLVERLQNRQYPEGMKVVVNGFVDNMAEWMSSCDTIITKAGPGTIAESLICGLPVLLNGFVPCQEAGNVPFVLDNKVGAFQRNPEKIAEVLASWLGPEKQEFEAMAVRAKRIGEKWQNALFRIVEDLAAMVKEDGSSQSAHSLDSQRNSWEIGAAV